MTNPVTKENLVYGGKYNWQGQPERLAYLGKIRDHQSCPGWHQFAKVDSPNKVWCEVRSEDLVSFEETK